MLYAAFLYMDITRSGDSTLIKYAALLLCVTVSFCGSGTLDAHLTSAALVFTAAADWFLLVQNSHYLLGVLLFLIVQALYFVKLALLRGKACYMTLPLRAMPALLFLFADTLTASSCLYFSNLLLNMLEAWQLGNTHRRLFPAGLTLFVLCDICVGAYNLGLLTGLTGIGMWLFYLPSQVCICLSNQE